MTLFSGAAAATGPANESAQRLTSLTATVSGLQDGANEVLRIDGTNVSLTDGTSGTTTAASIVFSVSVTAGVATVTMTPPTSSESSVFNTLINGLAYQNTEVNRPTPGNRVVTITRLSDNGGTANNGQDTATLNLSSTVSVTAVNDAPVLADTTLAFSAVLQGAAAPTGAVGSLVSSLVLSLIHI